MDGMIHLLGKLLSLGSDLLGILPQIRSAYRSKKQCVARKNSLVLTLLTQDNRNTIRRVPGSMERHQPDIIRKYNLISFVKCFMRISGIDQFADIDFGLLLLMNLQMRTHKIGMRMCLYDTYDLRSLCLCIIIIWPGITSRIYKHNLLINQNSIRKMGQPLILKLLDLK